MGLTNRIEVIDRDGWHREVTVEKSIVYIGSAQHNDLYLDPQRGAGVAPTHAQMIFSSESAGCQLVNLTTSEILIGGETKLAPEESADLGAETMIQLGDFTLLFHGSVDSPGGGGQNAGRNISLSVFLPANRLDAGRTLTGTARVRNLGSESGVQVDLDIEGLDPGCYSIEPGPVLAAGTERDIRFRIHHRGSKPAAGRSQFAVRAAARRAYMGEEVVSIHSIQVAPVYEYGLQIVPPAGASAASVSPVLPLGAAEAPRVESAPAVSLPAQMQSNAELYNTAWRDTPQKPPVPLAKPAPVTRQSLLPPTETTPQVRLGISGLTLTPDICKAMELPEQQTGVLVVAVIPGSLAAQAGLRAGTRATSVLGQQLMLGGDVITRINGQPVRRVEDQAAILATASNIEPHLRKSLHIGLFRDGGDVEVEARFSPPEAYTPQQGAASQEVTSEEVAGEGATSAQAPEEDAVQLGIAPLNTTGQVALPSEQPGNEQTPVQETQPAATPAINDTQAVVKLSNKAKPSTPQSKITAPKQKRSLGRASNAEASATHEEPETVKEAPKPQAQSTAQAEDSWWSSKEEQEVQSQAIQLKARLAPQSNARLSRMPLSVPGEEKPRPAADTEPSSQDWWADSEDETT